MVLLSCTNLARQYCGKQTNPSSLSRILDALLRETGRHKQQLSLSFVLHEPILLTQSEGEREADESERFQGREGARESKTERERRSRQLVFRADTGHVARVLQRVTL